MARFRPGLGRPRGRAREVRQRPLRGDAGSGLVPPPRGQRLSEGERGPSHLRVLSRDPHAGQGKAFGPGLRPSRRKGHGPPASPDVPPGLPRWVGRAGYPPSHPPPSARAGFSEANQEVASGMPYRLSLQLGQGDKNDPFRPEIRCGCHCTVAVQCVLSEDCSFQNCRNSFFLWDAATF